MQTIACHDCGKPVSLSARQCPQCGSKELAGPYRDSKNSGFESRNDRNLILTVVVLGVIGALYGIETGSGWARQIVDAVLYAFIGVVAAVPIAFAVNVTRNWR